MLQVWGRKTSSNVQALMWAIGELGLPYKRFDVGQKYGGNTTPEFLSMNPNGTIPVLKDGDGEPLWETGAILRYLSNRYGVDPFWPTHLNARTKVDMWAEWSKINIAQGFTMPIFWSVVRTLPERQDKPAIAAAIAMLTKKLEIAEVQLASRSYIASDVFTLADIQFGHILFRYFDIAIKRPTLPSLRKYYERLTERAAFREHVMVSYDELRAT
jgi:glutathione S-transferase